jgi:hypothetical protein
MVGAGAPLFAATADAGVLPLLGGDAAPAPVPALLAVIETGAVTIGLAVTPAALVV